MAYTTINKSGEHFNTKLFNGTGSTLNVTGIGFQPDLVWNKARSGANVNDHRLIDAVRGATKNIYSNSNYYEETDANGLTSFDSDGFTLGNSNGMNNGSTAYASWNWKANGAGVANTDGSINSTVSANTTSGFSIVKYTGTGSNATVGHGLGVAPSMIIFKRLVGSGWNWTVYHKSLGNNYFVSLNLGNAQSNTSSSTYFQDTTPTSSVFSIGDSGHLNGDDIIAYCFAEKQGYSKFGKYSAVGNVDGNFIYLGFKPSFFLAKRITDGTEPWIMFDNKRNPFNGVDKNLKPSLSEAEATQNPPSMDFLSNGIKFRNLDGTFSNAAGKEFIYMAFAEAPLVGTNNVPCTAR